MGYNNLSDLNSTPSSDRVHISFFGRTNAGKSSLINAVTRQKTALVSEIKGTTTDPVSKAMEILPIGPVVLTDTPGIDDKSILGDMRVKRAKQILNKTDLAVLVVDINLGISEEDKELEKLFKEKNIPYIIVYNKSDMAEMEITEKISLNSHDVPYICVSSEKGDNIDALKELMAKALKNEMPERRIVGDLINKGDVAVLVVPIDKAAPKGRLILPQQQVIRDILDSDGQVVVVKETGLKSALASLKEKPKVVITDSQAFEKVKKDTPEDIYLTSFSILFSRYKGDIKEAVRAAKTLSYLKEDSKILICEACTHHRQCDDIGTVKLPKWIGEFTGKKFQYEFTSGGYFPENLTEYKLIIHCGGCMINRREMQYRISMAKSAGIPITNYGILIAHMNGILERSVEILKLNEEKDKS